MATAPKPKTGNQSTEKEVLRAPHHRGGVQGPGTVPARRGARRRRAGAVDEGRALSND